MKYIADLTKPKDSEGNCIDPDYFPSWTWLDIMLGWALGACLAYEIIRWLL